MICECGKEAYYFSKTRKPICKECAKKLTEDELEDFYIKIVDGICKDVKDLKVDLGEEY